MIQNSRFVYMPRMSDDRNRSRKSSCAWPYLPHLCKSQATYLVCLVHRQHADCNDQKTGGSHSSHQTV